MRYFVLSVVMLAGAVGVMQLEPIHPDFTPVVRVRTTDGLFLTFVQSGAMKRGQCTTAVKLFSDVVASSCPTCIIESSGCHSDLAGMDKALTSQERLPIYTVAADPFRVAIIGPPHAVEAECREMAAQIVNQGVKAAVCRTPEVVPVAVR